MKNSFFTSLCFIIFSATFIILSDCSDHIQSKEIIPLFVFGDSFFDPGNNNYINTTNDFRANFLPYGETFFKYATGRFSDGRLLPDFIAEYAKLPLIPPYLEKGQKKNWVYGVNFASGGGGALVETHAGKAIDLKTQLGYFQNVEKELQSQLGNNEAKHLLSNSVYLFSVGGNDVIAPSSIFSSYSSEDYVSIVIGNYTQVIKELHKKGARKFGFASLFPVGCCPYSKAHNNNKGVNGLQCVEELTSLTKVYNAALSQRLQDLEKQLKGFRYLNFDTFGVVMDMIHNPSKYGFEDVENACCGSGAYGGEYTCGGMRGVKEYELCKDPESHLFFDSYHPSEKGHRLLAELMWHGVPNITRPFNLKSLFELTSCEGEFIKWRKAWPFCVNPLMGPDNLVKQEEELWIEQLPEKVDDITKFKLYETRSNFYMIGRNKSKTVWRVLKIERFETSELSIIEDSTTYSEIECKELLQRLKDGNKSNGGLKFVTKCYGIVGFIRFLGPYYMLLITKKRKIGEICGHAVFSITQSMMIPIPHSIEKCDKDYSKNENRYKKLLRSVDLTKDFFFSYSYKIMLSLQKNLSNNKPKMGIYDTMFVWNEFLTRGIRNQLKNSLWTVALVQGFFKQVKHRISGREFFLTLIARRSRHYAGTRYLKRGVNEKGRVANDVETEQIVSDHLCEGSVTQISSVVQNRGSIPLFWSQETSKLFIKPDIILSRKDNAYKATKLHFQNLAKRYGNPIIIFNLIKGRDTERKPRESILRAEFINAIDVINKELTEENELKYLHWDLSKHSRKTPYALERVVDLAARALEYTGLFYCQLPPTSQTKKSLNLVLKEDLAEKGVDTQTPVDDFATNINICTRNTNKDFHTNPPTFQKGVLRTNCIDCLDRTNVAQYAYGLVALGHQLHALGFINAPFISLGFPLAGHLMKLYEEMGDTLALQYGGSEAHNKIFSEKRGQWKATTHSQGLYKSIKRFCSNAYLDAEKQNAINVFLGHFQPQPLKPALWELDSDTHHNVGRHDYEFANEKSRLIIKRSLSDGVMVRESSSSLEDESIGKKQSSDHQSLDKLESEHAGLHVSESAPEISNCDGNISYSRYTPSLSGGKIFHAMQQNLESRNSLSLSERSESCDSSNFVDIDEISSSGNSCEDLYDRSSVLGSSCTDIPCFGNRTELRVKPLYRSGSSSSSPLGKEKRSATDVDLGFEQSPGLSVSADPFENWVMNGETFFI